MAAAVISRVHSGGAAALGGACPHGPPMGVQRCAERHLQKVAWLLLQQLPRSLGPCLLAATEQAEQAATSARACVRCWHHRHGSWG